MDFLHPHRKTHRHHAQRDGELVVREPQRNHNNDVATVVSVVFVTAQNTFPTNVPVQWITPTLANGNPVQATRGGDDDDDSTTTQRPHATSTTSKAVAKTTSQHTTFQTAVSGQSGDILPTSVKSTATHLNVAESSGSPTNTRSAATSTSTANAAASGSMSTGAKAGLALGVLILIGGVLALVLVAYKRKKDKKGERLEDDEKAALNNNSGPPPPALNAFAAAPIIREPSTSTSPNAPRLSLRPVTQFSPNLEKNNFNTTTPTGAATLSPNMAQQPASAWERRGAANAAANSPTTSANPFGDHAETMDSPTMPSASTMGPPAKQDKSELPSLPTISLEPEPIVAAAVAAGAIGLAATTSTNATGPHPPRTARPLPPVNISGAAADAPLPSPAGSSWTEDVPSSPGPAPAGALPVAGGPVGAPPGPNNVHRVQMDFAPSMEDELEIRAGQLVRMLHEYDDGWALCVRLDRSQQGVAPRTCLSKHPVKPRVGPPRGPPPPRGPMGPPGPNGSPRPLTPNGRNSPGPFPGAPRPLTPNGRNSPGPFANQPRPMSPSGRPMSPAGRPMSPAGRQPPAGRPRASSNAPAYGRSMSPGPYGAPGFPAPPRPDMKQRRRSNSASSVLARRNSPPGPSPLTQTQFGSGSGSGVARKPVPGQAL